MSMLHVVISPSASETRVLAMASPTETLLKAHLCPMPSHPRALCTLLEALALWQGVPARAALVAAVSAGLSDLRPYRNAELDRSPLYRVDWVPALPSVRRRREVADRHDFADLRELALVEVSR